MYAWANRVYLRRWTLSYDYKTSWFFAIISIINFNHVQFFTAIIYASVKLACGACSPFLQICQLICHLLSQVYYYLCPGIYGTHDNACAWQEDWLAYKCEGIDHMIMIFESLDEDTEVRRLSPQALYTDKYVDLVNGPQDHGWCHGYTCQERISTFYTMVATGKTYDVHFTSTNPQQMRLHLLNAIDTQKLVVGIFYSNPQRLDIYYNGRYVMPTNGKLNEEGDFIWENEPNKDYMPKLSSSIYGENYFDRDLSTLYILVRGAIPVDIVTTPVIVVSFGVPAVSVNEFFGENLINNLVAFLGVKKSQIRIVDIIAEDSVRRRRSTHIYEYDRRQRRAAEEGTTEVIFEVGNSPQEEISTDPADDDDDVVATTMAPDGEAPSKYN